ncbi:metalloregulator ArsR/SmtB family transcription factor [Arthrobacter sp. E3]|uniref:ArsR/SmtB family transcription factor n=1 Tax=Arthrobacter sp. E3 TaxID=517402 RepID=UPI001A94ED1D|nr:metalloregulator ArsR/SmtB family transcription factor [Arthrobacter sp. E3]
MDISPSCEPRIRNALSAADAQAKASLLKALADPNRLRLLSIVKSSPVNSSSRAEACVCELTGPLGLGQPTVSHHLKILVDAGLLHREKRGTWAYYSLVPGALESAAESILAL